MGLQPPFLRAFLALKIDALDQDQNSTLTIGTAKLLVFRNFEPSLCWIPLNEKCLAGFLPAPLEIKMLFFLRNMGTLCSCSGAISVVLESELVEVSELSESFRLLQIAIKNSKKSPF